MIFQEVRFGSLEKYYSFIDSIDINILNERGGNLLHDAISYKKKEIALDLIAKGINVNQQGNKGMTPLQHALELKDYDVVYAIIEAGADVNIRDSYGNNSLWTAVINAGDYGLVKLILEKGGDALTKNKAGRSPLDLANQIGDEQLIKLLKSPMSLSSRFNK
jgi:uncharacterized protein